MTQGTGCHFLSSPYCTQIELVTSPGYSRPSRRFLRSASCSSMLTMRRTGDRNVVARNRSNMVCKSTSPWAAARSNAASVPTTFSPRCRAIVTPSRSSINKRMAWSSDARDIASRSPASRYSRIDGLFQAHYFQPCRRPRNPRAHDGGSVCMSQLGLHSGRDQNHSIQFWKNIGCLDEYEIV